MSVWVYVAIGFGILMLILAFSLAKMAARNEEADAAWRGHKPQ